jgi:hypothetical protein
VPPLDFLEQFLFLAVDIETRNTEFRDEIVVENDDWMRAVHDCADRQLLLHRRSDLAHDRDVERRVKPFGDLEPHRHPTTRQRQDEHVFVFVFAEAFRQKLPGLRSIPKHGSRPRRMSDSAGTNRS